MKTNRKLPGLALAALMLAALACNLPARNGGSDATPIPVSTEAVQQMEENVQNAATVVATSGVVRLEFTEEQLTSLVALELKDQTEPQINNPQVLLRDGEITIQGEVTQSGITAPLTIAVAPSADADGRPHYRITSATFGPLPLPDSLMEQLTTQVDKAMAQELAPKTDNLFIESITIADGVMVITGRVRS